MAKDKEGNIIPCSSDLIAAIVASSIGASSLELTVKQGFFTVDPQLIPSSSLPLQYLFYDEVQKRYERRNIF